MRVLGLDVGSKTVGVAVSDPFGWTAQGVETLRRTTEEADLARLLELIGQYEVETIVVGLPLNMNGSKGPSAERAELLGTQLAAACGKPIVYQDERLSTVAAERVLIQGDVSRRKRKQVIDKMAAVYILQGYLDAVSK